MPVHATRSFTWTWTPSRLVPLMLSLVFAGCASPAGTTVNQGLRAVVGTSIGRVPIQPGDGIVGRARWDSQLLLLSSSNRLFVLSANGVTVVERVVTGVGDAGLAGLAVLPDRTVWTLQGWSTLLQLDPDTGAVMSRVQLDSRYTTLHAAADAIVYQRVDFTPGALMLSAGPPGDRERRPFGRLRIREGSDPGPLRWAQSVVHCGLVESGVESGVESLDGRASSGRVPCWATNDIVIDVVDADGTSRQVAASMLADAVVKDAIAFIDAPAPVIRDAIVDGEAVWVVADRTLWRLSLIGRVEAACVSRDPLRLILGAASGRLVLLGNDGRILSVECR